MDNAWPLWALPFWTMGVPLIWAAFEKYRTPKIDSAPTNFGVRPLRSDTSMARKPVFHVA